MAELPDLEVFSQILTRRYGGSVLEKLEVIESRKLNVPAKALKACLEGHKLSRVIRSGKTIQLVFGPDRVLGIHLMLRGELVALSSASPRFAILIFHFHSGEGFAVVDMQKQATPTLDPPSADVPDALELSYSAFKKLLSGKKMVIKTLLMDQKKLRGIGNSYGDEILYHAGISPFSIAGKIPEDSVKQLHKSIHSVLESAIKKIAGENGDELRGELRDFMEVHGAKIKNTRKGEEVISDKIGGRTSYYTRSQVLFS
ncbi:DNA-formamidopyrimidine glycosylase family protein [Pedobacter rhizosphaerae]|uniref:Formamidopyrimidine-DNA glycosylase n=1 Tax=Pedobacter rhizosphaerae TaxID=390241 RepID=A0A1H9TIR6_9SPHI|nr:DNA-formamidopyrimidine glycosylase family protein [Pedobacter rhizosphaerae]SER96917.1 formamidopyrimidine-DNA glycosylase [Pedobacter rhizosphaerae]